MSLCSITEPFDLVEKCRYEIDNIDNCSSQKEYDYIIFNCIITLNHLFEWYIKYEKNSDENKQKCILKFNPYEKSKNIPKDKLIIASYNEIKEFPELNEYQEAIRKLCNNTKHFNNKKIEYEVQETINIVTNNGDSIVDNLGNSIVCFETNYFIEINSIEIKIEKIIKVLICLWEQFYNINH